MFESAFLGFLQGVVEWLPVSSEGVLVLAQKNLFGSTQGITEVVERALFLHMGTFLAALLYFWKEVKKLIGTGLNYRGEGDPESKKILVFLLISTVISGTLGIVLLKCLAGIEESFSLTGKGITFIVGLLLLGTGGLQLRSDGAGQRQAKDLKLGDAILLGVLQGLAALPGLSRSGLTVSGLLLKRFDKTLALKLSFLMSLPIVLAGNIVLNLSSFTLTGASLVGLTFSFIFGYLTIGGLLRLAQAINFGYFVMLFGVLTLLLVFF